jgi:signal peptidase
VLAAIFSSLLSGSFGSFVLSLGLNVLFIVFFVKGYAWARVVLAVLQLLGFLGDLYAITVTGHEMISSVGWWLLLILIPILIVNCTLIIKGIFVPDQVPSFGGYIPLIVTTKSMQQVIPAGSLIICRVADPQDVDVGNIISFFDPESRSSSVVTHKVVRLEYETNPVTGEVYVASYRTKGTNNDIEDRLSVPAENLVGVYADVCFVGLGSVLLFMQSTEGLLLFLFFPIAAILIYEFMRRKKADKVKQDDLAALRAELDALKAEGNAVALCYGADAAMMEILRYLEDNHES